MNHNIGVNTHDYLYDAFDITITAETTEAKMKEVYMSDNEFIRKTYAICTFFIYLAKI